MYNLCAFNKKSINRIKKQMLVRLQQRIKIFPHVGDNYQATYFKTLFLMAQKKADKQKNMRGIGGELIK